jgi:hypothetical protein
MALYRHADMVRAIAGTCRVKFLSGLMGDNPVPKGVVEGLQGFLFEIDEAEIVVHTQYE